MARPEPLTADVEVDEERRGGRGIERPGVSLLDDRGSPGGLLCLSRHLRLHTAWRDRSVSRVLLKLVKSEFEFDEIGRAHV